MAVSATTAVARPITVRRSALALPLLGIAALFVLLLSTGHGAVPLSAGQIAAILAKQIGIDLPWAFEGRDEAVVLLVRLPRVLFGCLVGAGLSVSGALLQALFRNSLADPGLIGISSGAATGAALVIVLGGSLTQRIGASALPLAASVLGLAAMLVIHRVATVRGRTVIATMLLAGIAMNAAAGAVLGLMTFLADDSQLRSLTFWMMGSLTSGTWRSIAIIAPVVLVAFASMPLLARSLNALVLGEAEAGHLGIRVERVKRVVVLLAGLTVGSCTAFCGMIGFVGLVVPHLLRLAVGPDHRLLLPGSALLGATLLMAADLFARIVIAPAELPIGILTAVVGGPFFFGLLLREREKGGLV